MANTMERLGIITPTAHYATIYRKLKDRTKSVSGRTTLYNLQNNPSGVWTKLRKHHATGHVLLISHLLEEHLESITENLQSMQGLDKHYLLFVSSSTPVMAVPERVTRLKIRSPERIHLSMTLNEHDEESLIGRLLRSLAFGITRESVLDAWWENDVFVVLSPTFKRLHVPIAKLPALRNKSKEDLRDFQIDKDGSYVFWPKLDVHLGWDQFTQAVDSEAYMKARQKSDDFNRRYGVAIRTLREKSGLNQSQIEGLTPRQVRRIELGECRATHAALAKLAHAHRITTPQYMSQIASLL
jgi:hypothetical protein